jgi:hypothetical protein
VVVGQAGAGQADPVVSGRGRTHDDGRRCVEREAFARARATDHGDLIEAGRTVDGDEGRADAEDGTVTEAAAGEVAFGREPLGAEEQLAEVQLPEGRGQVGHRRLRCGTHHDMLIASGGGCMEAQGQSHGAILTHPQKLGLEYDARRWARGPQRAR